MSVNKSGGNQAFQWLSTRLQYEWEDMASSIHLAFRHQGNRRTGIPLAGKWLIERESETESFVVLAPLLRTRVRSEREKYRRHTFDILKPFYLVGFYNTAKSLNKKIILVLSKVDSLSLWHIFSIDKRIYTLRVHILRYFGYIVCK